MAALRCSDCGLDWPSSADYRECPQCLGVTDYFPTVSSMPAEEAKRSRLRAVFEREYDRRERGLESKCGPKRPPTMKQQWRLEELEVIGHQLNELELLYRAP